MLPALALKNRRWLVRERVPCSADAKALVVAIGELSGIWMAGSPIVTSACGVGRRLLAEVKPSSAAPRAAAKTRLPSGRQRRRSPPETSASAERASRVDLGKHSTGLPSRAAWWCYAKPRINTWSAGDSPAKCGTASFYSTTARFNAASPAIYGGSLDRAPGLFAKGLCQKKL